MKKINKLIISVIIIVLLGVIHTSIVEASSTKINTPKNVKASVSGTTNVKVKWSKVKNAKRYTIYRATSKKGKYKKVGTSKTTSFVNKNLARGKTYYYKVVANGKSSNSKKSNYSKIKILTKKQVLAKIRNTLKDKKWVNKNIKIKDLQGYSQTLYFGKIKNKELIVVEAVSEQAGRYQMFLVGYNNGKIVAASATDGDMNWNSGAPFVDLNKSISCDNALHHGYEYAKYYKIVNVKFKDLDCFVTNEPEMSDDTFFEINDKKVSKKKYKEGLKKYDKYNFISLESKGHKLTNKNIDKYVK